MKKVYEKPQIYMERFELSQSIASCFYNYQGTQSDPTSCTATEPDFGYIVFHGASNCTVIEDYCYEPTRDKDTVQDTHEMTDHSVRKRFA